MTPARTAIGFACLAGAYAMFSSGPQIIDILKPSGEPLTVVELIVAAALVATLFIGIGGGNTSSGGDFSSGDSDGGGED